MSLLVTALLLDKYGPLLSTENLAEVLHYTPGSLRNALADGRVPLQRGATGHFHVEDVARFIEAQRATPSPGEAVSGEAAPGLGARRSRRHLTHAL